MQYVVSATDAASATFERIAGSADHVLGKLDEIGKKSVTARLKLEGDKEAELTIDKLDLKMAKFGDRVAKGKLGADGGAAAMLEIRKLELEMDKLNAKRATIHIDTSALSKLSAFQPSVIGSAVALSPTLIPLLAGVAAGATAVAVSFGAAAVGVAGFGLMAKTVLSGASQDLQKLNTLNVALLKATTPAAKKAAEQAIAALKAGWSKGYLELIDNYKTFQTQWKSVSQAITVPTLNVWLPVLTEGLKFLKPLIKPIADAFTLWGQSLNTYFKDPAAAKNIRDMAAAFGNFAAQQLFRIGQFIKDIGEGIFNLGKDLAASGANFSAFGPWLSHIGDAFLTWSKSAKARTEVQGFMKFIHDEGPVVRNILKDLGTFLPGLFKGATTVGVLELQALANFLNLVASLPKGWQQPIVEFAGAMLLLSKLGVVKVGIKLTGLGLDALGAAGAGAAGGPLAAAGAAIAAGLILRIREDLKKGFKGIVSDLPTFLSGSTGVLQVSAQGWADAITSRFQKPVLAAQKAFGRAFTASAKATWDDVTASARAFGHDMAASFAALRHDIATIWDTIWRNTITRMGKGVSDVAAGLTSFRTAAVSRFNSIKTGVANVWNTLWSILASATRTGVSRIGTAVNAIKNAFMTPIRWVVSHVLTPLVNVWDKIAGAVGAKSLVFHLPAFAEGGKVTAGTGPTADDVLVRVSRHETIVSAAHSALLAPVFSAVGVPGYAGGGKAGQNPPAPAGRTGLPGTVTTPGFNIGDLIGKGLSWVTGHLLSPITGLLGNVPGASGAGNLVAAAGKTLIGAVAKGIAGMISGLGASGSAIVRDAMSWIGKIPYVWGGTAIPGGADCSGFVQAIYGRHGINAPRTSEAQGAWVHRAGPTPGGLAFYNSPAGGPPPGHVAIVGEGGKVISQGGGMGPQLVGLHAFPLMWTGVPPGGGLSTGVGRTGSYSVAGMARLWQQVGGPAGVAHLMGAIGMAESTGDPRAHNPSGASGLWQILGLPFPGNPFIPATNARMALSKYRSQGLGAWTTYTDGAYRAFFDRGGLLMPGVTMAVNNTGQPEHVVGPASMTQVVALLAQILAAVRIAPSATSAGTARALNSAARAAVR